MHGPRLPQTPPPQTLGRAERQQILAVLNEPGYRIWRSGRSEDAVVARDFLAVEPSFDYIQLP